MPTEETPNLSDSSSAAVIEGDALEQIQELPAASFDLIATDPPYFRVKDEPWDRQWDTKRGFLSWMERLCDGWRRVLKPNGSLYVFAGPRMAREVANVIAEQFVVLNEIVWVKDAGKHRQARKESLRSYFPQTERIIFAEQRGADSAYAAADRQLRAEVFEPIRSYLDFERDRAGFSLADCNRVLGTSMASHYFNRSQWTFPSRAAYEALTVAFNGAGARLGRFLDRPYPELEAEYERLRAEFDRRRTALQELRRTFRVSADVPYTDVWTFDPVLHFPGKHPCEKPLEMMEHIIEASSLPGHRVADFFGGRGTTAVAAVRLRRSATIVELSPHWAQAARERCAAEIRATACDRSAA